MASDASTDLAAPASFEIGDGIAADLERIVVGAVGLTTRALAQADTGFELTFPQWRALLVLGEREDGARIGEVAARVGVTLPATSRLLRRLERRGLTAFAPDELDRRATRARLTIRGRGVRAAILEDRRAALREIAGTLSTSEGLDLAAGLRAIADELEQFA
jgi:DNA-binding MarR family transcriptional regulator